MGKTKYGRILIGILCVILLILVTVIALYLDSKSPDPIFGVFQPYEPTKPSTVPDEPFGPPNYLPPSVTIPPDNGKTEISFPCDVPGYDLTIENGVADQLKVMSSLASLTRLHLSGTSVGQDTLNAISALPQ